MRMKERTMKKFLILLLALLLAVSFASCDSGKSSGSIAGYEPAEAQAGVPRDLENGACVWATESGCYYKLLNDGHGQIRFYDYVSKQSVPVCNRPNCPHDLEKDADCDAYIESLFMYEYEGHLYESRGTGTNYAEVYVYDKDLSNETFLFSVEAELNGLFFANGKLFYIAETQNVEVTGNVGIEKTQICAYDLNTKTHTVLTETGADISNNILYVGEEYLVYLNSVSCDFDPMAITADTVLSEVTLYRYTLKNGETEVIAALDNTVGANFSVYDAVVYYREKRYTALKWKNIKTGESGEIAEGENMQSIVRIADGKVFYSSVENVSDMEDVSYAYYDLASGESHTLQHSDGATPIWTIVSERQEYFILDILVSDETALHISKISMRKENFYKENALDNPANYDVIYAYDQLWE